jgi:hypothetical protein
MVYEKGCMMLLRCLQEEKNQHQIQLKLSTIFKYEAINSYQVFGSFYDTNGEKYCAVSVLLKYLGYGIAIVSKQIQNKENSNLEELIPDAILEKVENFSVCDSAKESLRCSCSRPDYYYYSLIPLLIHLNDYHKMTFAQIGDWLDGRGM